VPSDILGSTAKPTRDLNEGRSERQSSFPSKVFSTASIRSTIRQEMILSLTVSFFDGAFVNTQIIKIREHFRELISRELESTCDAQVFDF
jgi:hypothetical protein